MSRTIATILNLRDLFSPTLNETVTKTKEFQRQIQHTQNDIAKFRDGVSESFGNVKTKVAGVVAGLGVATFAKQSVELASNLVEVQNVVDTTFGSGAAQINTWSKTALNAFGLNQLQAKQFTGYLGAMMKSSGITGDALTKMSENLVGLAGDMASFDNLDPEVAFEKIRSGISGETEPLKEIGINMDVANLKAFALSQGIKKSYDSMSQAEQVTLRYNYLMSVTADKHGDFAKTQQTFANQMRIAKANIEQAGASIATGFLPYLNKLLLMFNNGGLKSIGSIFSSIGNTIVSVANSAKTPVQSLVNSLGSLAQTSGLKTLFSGVDSKPLETLKYTINSVIYGVRDLVNFISSHMTLAKTILAGFAGGFVATKFIQEAVKMQKAIKDIHTGINGLRNLSGVGKLFSTIFAVPAGALGIIAFVAAFAAVAYLVISHWSTVKTFFAGLWAGISNTFSSAVNGIKGIVSSIGTTLSGVWNSIKSVALLAWNGLKAVALPIWNGIKFAILSPILLIVDLVSGNWKKLYTDSIKIFNTLKLGITTIWNGIKLFFTTLWNGIKTVALLAWNGLKTGIVTIVTGIGSWIVNTFTAVVTWFTTLPSRLYQAAVNMFTSFKTGVSNTTINIGIWISQKFQGFVSFFTSLPSKALTWAHDMIDGFVNGITNKIASVKKGAENIADTIRKILHFSTPDEGPLKPYATWMPDFVNGMNQGIVITTPNIVKGVTDMTTNMTTPINGFVSASNGLGISAIQELSAGIASQEGNAVATAQNLASRILQGVKDIFGIHSPSREMGTVGINFMQGFIDKLKSSNIADVIKTVFGDIASLANGTLGGAISNIVSNFINMGDLKGLGSTLQGIMQYGVGFLSGGGNLSQWIQLAMALTGVSSDWMGPLQEIIQHESGGNPNAINLWDSNAMAGHPSKGLMQLIDANMQEFHLPGMDNVYDPISNIAAGIRLIQHDYGSIYNVPGIKALTSGGSYVGYVTGTNSANKGVAELAEDGAELVTGRQFRNLNGGEHVYTAQETKGLLGSKSDSVKVYVNIQGNVIGNEEFADQVGSHVATKVLTALHTA